MRTGTEPPVLNIENRVIYWPDLIFMVLYRSIYLGILNVMTKSVTYNSKIDFIILRAGAELPVLKIDHMGIFQLLAVLRRFLGLNVSMYFSSFWSAHRHSLVFCGMVVEAFSDQQAFHAMLSLLLDLLPSLMASHSYIFRFQDKASQGNFSPCRFSTCHHFSADRFLAYPHTLLLYSKHQCIVLETGWSCQNTAMN